MTAAYNAMPDLRLAGRFGLSAEQAEELLEFVWPELVKESAIYPELITEAVEGVTFTDAQVAAIMDQLAAARRQQQASTPVPDGALRLDAAFDELNENLIMARQNFSCCGNCAPGDIQGEMEQNPADWRGYVYFHTQDADSLIETGATYIGYGIVPSAFISKEEWDRYDEKALDVWYDKTSSEFMKREVLPVLEKHGIEVEWNGNFAQRVLLSNIDYANTDPATVEA